jgi:hypothetical protein
MMNQQTRMKFRILEEGLEWFYQANQLPPGIHLKRLLIYREDEA